MRSREGGAWSERSGRPWTRAGARRCTTDGGARSIARADGRNETVAGQGPWFKEPAMKKTLLIVSLTLVAGWGGWGAPGAPQLQMVESQGPIESELALITPVSKFIHDAALKAFADHAKEKWNVTVKVSAIPAGTPVAYGRIVASGRAGPRWTSSGAASRRCSRSSPSGSSPSTSPAAPTRRRRSARSSFSSRP